MSFGILNNSAIAMMTHSHAMGQIGTNVANVNTSGYKASESLFQTQLSHQMGKLNIYTATPNDRRYIDVAGTAYVSGRTNDLNISGQGFFVVSPDFSQSVNSVNYYTRAGDFASTPIEDRQGQKAYLTTQSGHYVLGWNADRSTGVFSSKLEPIHITPLEEISGVMTTNIAVRANIKADTTETQRLDMGVYDSDFKSQGLIFHFTPVDGQIANQWMLSASVNEGTVTSSPILVQFDQVGNMISPKDGKINIGVSWNSGSSASLNVDFSKTTQLGSTETVLYGIDQDGMADGILVGTSWDSQGVLHGNYNNGRSVAIAKVAIATFTAPNNLDAVSGNLFAYNPQVGQVKINDLQNKDLMDTSIDSGVFEMSNVDLGDQFTKMITTQKAYSSAAKVFQTGDEMYQVATNLKT